MTTASGLEQAVFGKVTVAEIDGWLDRHVLARLGVGMDHVAFRAGRVGAVYGVRLLDGTDVVVKVPRGSPAVAPVDAAVSCQRHLADRGYPCPAPVGGPTLTEGRLALIETMLETGRIGNVRDPALRRATATSLAEQVRLLLELSDLASALAHPPAWARHQDGPWPEPHDSIFDFTSTPDGSQWLDALATAASRAINSSSPLVVGHADWTVGNIRFADCAVVAAYDWDSLVADTEPVIAGFAAGSYTAGNVPGPSAPTPVEVGDFLGDYADHRPAAFDRSGRATAAAAATWVLAYNARCQLSRAAPGEEAPAGSALAALASRGSDYLELRW